MPTEPVFIAQCGDLTYRETVHSWFRDRAKEAAETHGCNHFRYSQHHEIPDLFLVEGWIGYPEGWDYGEPRWQLAAIKPVDAA
jgi:hypothetical protein